MKKWQGYTALRRAAIYYTNTSREMSRYLFEKIAFNAGKFAHPAKAGSNLFQPGGLGKLQEGGLTGFVALEHAGIFQHVAEHKADLFAHGLFGGLGGHGGP